MPTPTAEMQPPAFRDASHPRDFAYHVYHTVSVDSAEDVDEDEIAVVNHPQVGDRVGCRGPVQVYITAGEPLVDVLRALDGIRDSVADNRSLDDVPNPLALGSGTPEEYGRQAGEFLSAYHRTIGGKPHRRWHTTVGEITEWAHTYGYSGHDVEAFVLGAVAAVERADRQR